MRTAFTYAAEKIAQPTLRERLTLGKLAQVELAIRTRSDELQTLLNQGLSPAKIDQRQFELDALRDLKANLGNQLEVIAQQNAASRRDLEADDQDDGPVYTPYVGGFRSERAFLETLQRERAKVRPLPRDQWDRAKASAAKRSRRKTRGVDVDPNTVFAAVHPTWYTQPGQVRSYMFAKETLTGIDPCLEKKKVRRQVMFAQRTAGIGYRVKHEVVPC